MNGSLPLRLFRAALMTLALAGSRGAAFADPPTVVAFSRPIPKLDEPDAALNSHLNLLGVSRWHAGGYGGQGVKVAVLDTGFRDWRRSAGREIAARTELEILPQRWRSGSARQPTRRPRAEVLHAIAPRTQAIFANWEPDNQASFLQAVKWAKEQGAKIISCSVVVPSWSDGDGGGPIHRDLERILGDGSRPGDVLFFASAGNTALRHLSGNLGVDKDGWHHWRPGEVHNRLQPWGTEPVLVELYGSLRRNVVLQIVDNATGTVCAEGRPRFESADPAWTRASVRIEPMPGHSYSVRLFAASGGTGNRFHVVVLGGNLEISSPEGSVPFPGDGRGVIAVGAVDREGKRLAYSSCGVEGGPRPDMVGVVPFPCKGREKPFSGTSAAAPQAAAIAAVLWSRHPEWTAAQVKQALRHHARDVGPEGVDNETGHGLARLPQ
ncbi:MAG: S8 family serine peptidase [Gemmataceae bacterium]